MSLDITAFTQAEKDAVGNSVAYGLHAASCNSVSNMWTTMQNCMTGTSNVTGASFGMTMGVDSQLGSGYGCSGTGNNCYGGAGVAAATTAAAGRRLAAVTLKNKADFGITLKAAALKSVDTKKLTTATKAVDAAAVQKTMTAALASPAITKALGAKATAVSTAAAKVTVKTVVKEVVKTQAPSTGTSTTSGAYTAGVASALLAVAGALLF
jgi:hypothetical protein